VSQRRVVPLALLVTALLAVVAIVARGRPLGSGGAGRGGLPLSFWDYTYTTIVIVAVPILLAGVFAIAFIRRRAGKRRNVWQSLLRALILYGLLIGLELLVFRHLNLSHLHLHRHVPQEPGAGPGRAGQNGTHHQHAGTRTLQFRWGELLVVLGLLVVLAAGAIVAIRRSRPDAETALDLAPEALVAALDESLDDLRSDPDLRRAIIAAYARMETALAAAGIPRRPAEAPLEYLERALLTLEASGEAVRRLTDLFEWARFSQHEPEPSMRDDAVNALIAVRDELRASELTPA
jgi:Domain of unknown function (DUF4129)